MPMLRFVYGRDVAGNPQGLPVMVIVPGLLTLSLFPPAPLSRDKRGGSGAVHRS